MENLPPSAVTGPVTDAERAYVLEALKTSKTNLHAVLDSLSDSQLTYKPNPARWSIAECVEHIALIEKGIFKTVQTNMDLPADPDRRAEIRVSDVDVIKAVCSRSVTLAAPDPFVPTGRFGDTATALQFFDQQRDAAIDYVQAVQGDLRTHYFPHRAFGTLDAYQAILLMAMHVERHRKQIEEIKASTDFPVVNA